MCAHFLRVFLLLGSLAFVLASANRTTVARQLQNFKPLNPDTPLETLNEVSKPAIPQLEIQIHPMTNARRFAAGLPPLPPKHLRRATGTTIAHRESPSSVPTPSTPSRAHIEVREVGTYRSLGFIGRVHNAFGEAGVTADPTSRMIFTLPASGGLVNLMTINGLDSKYPVLGGVKGFSSIDSNMGPSSSNYATIGSTVETSRNSPPVTGDNTFSDATGLPETVESAIWAYNPVNGALTPQWVNTDSSKPSIYLGYIGGFFVLTGDQTAFTKTYGAATWVLFTVVPISS